MIVFSVHFVYLITMHLLTTSTLVAGVGISQAFVCLSARYLKNRCSYGINKLDIEMIHHESWKPI